MGAGGSGGAKPYGWANRAMQDVNAVATAPSTSRWAEAALSQAFISMGDPGVEKPEGARSVQAHISVGQPEAHKLDAAETFKPGGDPVIAHTSIGNPMGLERDLKAYSALPGQTACAPALEVQGYPHVLISFVYDRAGEFFTERLGYNPHSWMGDSGAYTVWTKGETVDLGEYIEWCRRYVALNPDFTVVSLDVRPGEVGRAPTSRERDRGMAQSLENGDRLRDAGFKITEVFHLHEPLSFFETLLERRQPGERVGIGGGCTVPFVDRAFSYLRDTYGWANLPPLHGFGMSPISEFGMRYPWFSCDSSSWMSSARYGHAVGRGGRKGDADTRSTNRAVRTIYLQRVLERWNRQEQELTRLWHSRGVRYAD